MQLPCSSSREGEELEYEVYLRRLVVVGGGVGDLRRLVEETSIGGAGAEAGHGAVHPQMG